MKQLAPCHTATPWWSPDKNSRFCVQYFIFYPYLASSSLTLQTKCAVPNVSTWLKCWVRAFFKREEWKLFLIRKLSLKSSEKEKEGREDWQGASSALTLPVPSYYLWRFPWKATCPCWVRTCAICIVWSHFIYLSQFFGIISLTWLFFSLPLSYHFKANTMSSHGLIWTTSVSQCDNSQHDSSIMRRMI